MTDKIAAFPHRRSPPLGAVVRHSERTFSVGAVVPHLDYALYAPMLNSFQDVMTQAGHTVVVVCGGFDPAGAARRVKLLVVRGADAILSVGRLDERAVIDLLQRRNLPVVTTYSHAPDAVFPSIGFDSAEAVRQVMAHMWRLGHRECVMLTGPPSNNDRQIARVNAFSGFLAQGGIDPTGRVVRSVYAPTPGAQALQAIRRERPATTCVVCDSDIMALGVMAECRRLGIAVPGALSVTGFDDIPCAAITDPPLTTIALPGAEMGRLAAESLLRALGGDRTTGPVLLDSSLVLRASTGRPRQRWPTGAPAVTLLS
jgi:LacI family transcriptional regulator